MTNLFLLNNFKEDLILEIWKWIIFIIFIVVELTLSLFLYSAIKISGECSREEENYKKEDLK